MPFTTVAFFEASIPGATFAPIAAVADQHVRVVGDDIQVPTLNQIVAIAGGISAATAIHQLRISAPSLRERGLYQVAPLNVAATDVEPASPHAIIDLRDNPLVLVNGEQMNADAIGDPAAVQEQWCVVWLADGPIVPVKGNVFTIRVTGATALGIGAWTNVALTFTEDLPRGRYRIVGLRPQSAGCIAARAVFVGGGWRPGALGCDVVEDHQSNIFRGGNLGDFGEFEDIEPPTLDFLSISADATQAAYLDLIQVRKGPA